MQNGDEPAPASKPRLLPNERVVSSHDYTDFLLCNWEETTGGLPLEYCTPGHGDGRYMVGAPPASL